MKINTLYRLNKHPYTKDVPPAVGKIIFTGESPAIADLNVWDTECYQYLGMKKLKEKGRTVDGCFRRYEHNSMRVRQYKWLFAAYYNFNLPRRSPPDGTKSKNEELMEYAEWFELSEDALFLGAAYLGQLDFFEHVANLDVQQAIESISRKSKSN